MNNKGQAVLSEYVMIFFVVVAALLAMAVYVQRGLQGRISDTRDYLLNAVAASGVCDANCVRAAGGNITTEYEPYYLQTLSGVNRQDDTEDTARPGNPNVIGAVYRNIPNQATTAVTTSYQLPPGCSDAVNPKPSYCPQGGS